MLMWLVKLGRWLKGKKKKGFNSVSVENKGKRYMLKMEFLDIVSWRLNFFF